MDCEKSRELSAGKLSGYKVQIFQEKIILTLKKRQKLTTHFRETKIKYSWTTL